MPKNTPVILLTLCAFALSSCRQSNVLVVGSKNFTEQIVLGEIAAQLIETRLHLPVQRRLDLGGTLLSHLALTNGEIDLYPEYTGTALTSVLKLPLQNDPDRVFRQVADAYRQRFHLIWLRPLGFNDSFAMAVRRQDADALPARTLSAAYGRSWRLGVGYEFLTRADGFRRLNAAYHLNWSGLPKTMDLGLLYRALAQRQIDMAAANTTDGLLTSPAYAVLADDKHAFPPYQACFVVRENSLARFPGLQEVLAGLEGTIDERTMRTLNRRVDIDHVSVVRVAADFLAGLHLRSGGA